MTPWVVRDVDVLRNHAVDWLMVLGRGGGLDALFSLRRSLLSEIAEAMGRRE